MMEKTYTVRYEKNAQKAVKKMDKHQARLILSWISKNYKVPVLLGFMGKVW